MKANEYIKRYGIDDAKSRLKLLSMFNLKDGDTYMELKRFIESHEVVASFGGLEHAKRFLAENIPCTDSESLNNAIADVESCQ